MSVSFGHRVVDRCRLHAVGRDHPERQRATLLDIGVERDQRALIVTDRRNARVEDRRDACLGGLRQPRLQQLAHGVGRDRFDRVDDAEHRGDLEYVAGGFAVLRRARSS